MFEKRECEDWLRDVLKEGPVTVKDLQRAAKDAAFSFDMAKRAKQRIGAESFREGFGRNANYLWRMPGEAGEASAGDANENEPVDDDSDLEPAY